MREGFRIWIVTAAFLVGCAIICGSGCPTTNIGTGTNSVTASSGGSGGTTGTTSGAWDPSKSAGHYTGQWVDSTLGVSGNAVMDVAVNTTNQTATVMVDAGPNLFGEGDPPADNFSGSYSNGAATFSGVSNKYGNVTMAIDSSGGVNGSATNVNSSVVDHFSFTGTATATKLSLNLNVHLISGATHTGTVILNKQ